jgi:hypothetical protein
MSPGRALLEVKEKLKNYRRQDGDGSSICAGSIASDPMVDVRRGAVRHGEQAVSKGAMMHNAASDQEGRGRDGYGRGEGSTSKLHKSDTNIEIAEIDSRLQALQEFLKSAKQSAGQ